MAKKKSSEPSGSGRLRNADEEVIQNTTRWRMLKRWKLSHYTECERCGAPATEVGHIDDWRKYVSIKRLEVAYNPSNLASLCSACYSGAPTPQEEEIISSNNNDSNQEEDGQL